MKMRAYLLLSATVGAAMLMASPVLAERWTIEHVTLIDGTGAAPRSDMTVVVDGDHFVEVSPSTRAAAVRGKVIDGRGKYLIPGLMDIHIHLAGMVPGTNPDGSHKVDRTAAMQALSGFLYAGVTTVLDVGNYAENTLPLRAEERAGRILSPHLLATGNLVTYPGSHGDSMGVTITSWPEGRATLQAQFDAQHPDVQKITYDDEGWGSRPLIPILPRDLLQHIAEFYNDHGVRTTVHISNEARAREAIYSGVDTLAHTPAQGPVTDAFVKMMAAKQTPTASTMTIGENYARVHDHPEYLDQPLYAATMTAAARADLKRIAAEGGETALKNSAPLFRRGWRLYWQTQTPILQDNLRRIDAAGGVVAAGTDSSSGAATHRELELLSQAGIPNLHVIKIATYNAARLLGRQDEMGSISEGKLADAVLLNADPLADINNTKNIALVMKAGAIIDESKLSLAGGKQARRFTPHN